MRGCAAEPGKVKARCSVECRTQEWSRRVAAKKKAEKFSVTKAVKANARERVGQPKPSRLIEDKHAAIRRNVKHKEKLVDLLTGEPE
jgi:hypothetical protein